MIHVGDNYNPPGYNTCPYAGGCRGCHSTPPETAGIDFYSGFRKDDQGGVQIEILKNPGIDFYSGFRKNYQGGCKSKSY